MARVKGVIGALLPFWEAAHAAELAQIVEAVLSPAEDLMGIGLMAHVPYDLILRKIKGQVQGHGQLHDSQVGGQMTACTADLFQQKLPDLLRQHRIIFRFQLLDIRRLFYLFQKHSVPTPLSPISPGPPES